MNIDLSGQVAVVTGASGELGRVIARTLAEAGADVAVHYLNSQAKAESVAEDIRKLGRRAVTIRADITIEAGTQNLHHQVVAQLGQATIIVNNAVSQYPWKTVLQQDPADYETQFRSCVLQNVLMAQAFVPDMIARKSGRIIAINTECAMVNDPTQSAYVAGKRGMDGVLRVLAKEIGMHGITVNQVAPGWMISDKYRGIKDESQPDYEKSVPLHRRGYDQDIANAVAFLASDLASFITGVYLPVCGGRVMPGI